MHGERPAARVGPCVKRPALSLRLEHFLVRTGENGAAAVAERLREEYRRIVRHTHDPSLFGEVPCDLPCSGFGGKMVIGAIWLDHPCAIAMPFPARVDESVERFFANNRRQQSCQIQKNASVCRIRHRAFCRRDSIRPDERNRSLAARILRNRGGDAALVGVGNAKKAFCAREVHSVTPCRRKREHRHIEASFGETREKRRTILEENSALVRRRRIEEPAVEMSQTRGESLAPFVGVAEYDDVRSARGGGEHGLHVAFREPRLQVAENHVWGFAVRIELCRIEAPLFEEGEMLQRAPEAYAPRLEIRRRRGVDRSLRRRLSHEAAEVRIALHACYGMAGQIVLDFGRERTGRFIRRGCGRDGGNGGNGGGYAFHDLLLFLISSSAAIAENCVRAATVRSLSSDLSLNARFAGSHSIVSPGLFIAW